MSFNFTDFGGPGRGQPWIIRARKNLKRLISSGFSDAYRSHPSFARLPTRPRLGACCRRRRAGGSAVDERSKARASGLHSTTVIVPVIVPCIVLLPLGNDSFPVTEPPTTGEANVSESVAELKMMVTG